MNPGTSSTPTDLNGLRRLMTFITSESETGDKCKNSEDDEMVGRTLGQGMLYTDWKCVESSSATSLGWFKCLPSTSSWMELEFFS
jgi:hypothetical protein